MTVGRRHVQLASIMDLNDACNILFLSIPSFCLSAGISIGGMVDDSSMS